VRHQTDPGYSADEIEDLRRAGFGPEQIQDVIDSAKVPDFGLWPENDALIQIALDCHWDRSLGGMGGRIWNGVSSSEVTATMRVYRTPSSDRLDTLRLVRLFVSTACGGLNNWESERAEEARR